MKLSDILIQLSNMESKIGVYEDLIAYLEHDDLEIPVESGTASPEVVGMVRQELVERRDRLVECLSGAEDVEVEDVELEAPGDGRPLGS